MPVVEKPSRSFSIKEVISDNRKTTGQAVPEQQNNIIPSSGNRVELTGETLLSAWHEFIETLKDEGPRIVSMFKTIRPEMEDDHTIRIHLTNAAQKDLFILNYKPKLTGFLERRFLTEELDIESSVDLAETNEMLYTDEQKYNYLSSKYPVLRDFKKTFNLDLP